MELRLAEFKVPPQAVFKSLGEPDSVKVNPETGEKMYYHSGSLGSGGILGAIASLFGTKPASGNINNLKQEINNVSPLNNPNDFNQVNTLKAIDEVNKLYSDAGYGDVAQFMKNIAATESNIGEDELGEHSFGAFQVDPTKYIDIVDRSHTGAAKQRMDLANKFLQEKLGDENFDLRTALDVSSTRDEKGYVTSAKYNPNQTLRTHNPYIAATLARLGLANIPDTEGSIPDMNLRQQADYWKKYWNTQAGKGTLEHFMKQSQYHSPELEEQVLLDEVVNPASQKAFE
jgi:hypothetical protein